MPLGFSDPMACMNAPPDRHRATVDDPLDALHGLLANMDGVLKREPRVARSTRQRLATHMRGHPVDRRSEREQLGRLATR